MKPAHSALRPAVRLHTDEAHVWLAATEEVTALDCLSSEELRRWSRILPREPRRAFAAAHALTRHALSWCVPAVRPSEWQLRASKPHGRPEISAPLLAENIRVNLSHTDDMVAVVVTRAVPCGIDVERRTDPSTVARLSERVLSAAESTRMRELAPDARADHFCLLWTLKEATTKALGKGLSLPFATVGFDFDESHQPHRADGDREWSMKSWRASPQHHVSVAVHAPAVDFVIHKLPEEIRV